MTDPKISATRSTERAGIVAALKFFEENACVFLEVPQQHDFGKDAYVDITRDGTVTPLCIALQIKSGRSYRTEAGNYFIPLDHHAKTWRFSTVPIFGLVFDPDDKKIRWIDLTGFLRKEPSKSSGSIPIDSGNVLTKESLAMCAGVDH